MAKHNEIGKIGEDIAKNWLKSKGFYVIRQNYWKKFGEIDIVARPSGRQARGTNKLHFVEVKSVSYETKDQLDYAVSHLPDRQAGGTWRPEENVHSEKIRRMKNAIEAFLHEYSYKGLFQVDIVTVRMVPREKYAQVKMIENVIFD